MTSPHYPVSACADGSQDRGDNAWIVNFDNGNSNNDHRDNNNRVRAVRGPSREFQGATKAQPVTLRDLHTAWKRARQQKVPSANQLSFDTNWGDRLLDLADQLNAGTWSPKPTTCFIAERPKAQIVQFLADELRLSLKEDAEPKPLTDGIDFLGYVVRPTHTTVRRRVVSHARAALAAWESAHICDRLMRGTPDDFRAVRSVWSSYDGHFTHANSYRLRASLRRRFPWIDSATRPRRFRLSQEGRTLTFPVRSAP